MCQCKVTRQSPLLKGGADKVGGGLHEKHFLPRNKNLKLPARELRSNATKQENHLWYDFLCKFSPRFLRQYVINNYILDFYCHKVSLAVELDGSQHYEKEAVEYDEARTEYLNGLGIEVLRFSNRDVDKNFAGVCENITAIVEEKLKQSPVSFADTPF